MSHPLAKRPAASSHFPKYTGDGSPSSVAQWAKSVPVKETVTLPGGRQIDVFNLRQRIMILSPSYGFQVTEYYLSALERAKEVNANYRMPDGSIQRLPVIADRINVPNDSHIDRARNTITNVWIDGDLTDWGYWWDVDVSGPPQFMARLFIHACNGHKFVCGHYAMKDIRPTFVANVRAGSEIDPTTRLRELTDGATGSMLWHRDVPLKLRTHAEVKPYFCAPNSQFAGQLHWAYFSSGVYGPGIPEKEFKPEWTAALAAAGRKVEELRQWLSEDWKVCRLWQELGEKVMGDTEIKLHHFGGLNYPPRVEEIDDALAHLIEHHHPVVNVTRLREVLAKYQPPKKAEDRGQKTEDSPEKGAPFDEKLAA